MSTTPEQQDRKGLLQSLDPKTRILGLICLVAEALFLGSLTKLEGAQVFWALFTCAAVLCVLIYAIVKIEASAQSTRTIPEQFKPSREEMKYDAFVSIPMAATATEEDYQKYRNTALAVIKALKDACKCETIFCSAETIATKAEFDVAQISLETDIRNVARSKWMVMIYVDKLVSSVLVEVGAAIALGRPVVVFTKDASALPYLLRESSHDLAYSVFQYHETADITARVRQAGANLFPRPQG